MYFSLPNFYKYLKAGIPDDLLTLAYEPEAAALCCKEMVVQRSQGLENCNLESFSVGQKFIVLDCGGKNKKLLFFEMQFKHLKLSRKYFLNETSFVHAFSSRQGLQQVFPALSREIKGTRMRLVLKTSIFQG